MAARIPGFMITLDREEEFDLERLGTRMRVTSIFVDEQDKELWFRGTNHYFGGRHEQIRLGYEAGRLTHYSDVITDDAARRLIAEELSQALAA